jgi:hypothetical protein
MTGKKSPETGNPESGFCGPCKTGYGHGIKIQKLEQDIGHASTVRGKMKEDISARLPTKIGLWIIGVVIVLMSGAAGTFAVAQRSAIQAQQRAMEKQASAIEQMQDQTAETDRRFEEIRGQLNTIAVHIEYIKKQMDKQSGPARLSSP